MKIQVLKSSRAKWAPALALAVTTVLAGCGRTDSASFVIDRNYDGFSLGAGTALTFEREKAYAWSNWELAVVVRHDPDCQRRHALLTTSNDAVDVQLYMPERGVYIVRAGRRWYVTELKSCRLQAFNEPPPEPGPLVGTVEASDRELKFIPTSQAVR